MLITQWRLGTRSASDRPTSDCELYMQIIKNIQDWKKIRKSIPAEKTLGLLATMGCLHAGHASLLKRAITENDYTLLTIFVNPTQFNDSKDYENYPAPLEQDLGFARNMGVDFVITPSPTEMYPDGNFIQVITEHPFSKIMEGRVRPGHFNGMLTIVMKLLILAEADRTYFGEKDYQQLFLVREMAKNYLQRTEVVPCPTMYEPSGLPLSSRNTRLNSEERKLAETFFNWLQNNTSSSLTEIHEQAKHLKIPVDYLEIHDKRLFIAIRIGSIRIIDNKLLQRSIL